LAASYRLGTTPAGRQSSALLDNSGGVVIRASRYPDAFLKLIGGLAFRLRSLTHDRFDKVQFRAERIRVTRTRTPETKSRDRPQYFVVTNDQSCAGVERAEKFGIVAGR
jgi:hypothetical protein